MSMSISGKVPGGAHVGLGMLTNDEVLKLEGAVMAMTDMLKAVRAVMGETGYDCKRDLRGTLHVNLCALSREADRVAKALEREFGFVRGWR